MIRKRVKTICKFQQIKKSKILIETNELKKKYAQTHRLEQSNTEIERYAK